jgi:hypothetical protein
MSKTLIPVRILPAPHLRQGVLDESQRREIEEMKGLLAGLEATTDRR